MSVKPWMPIYWGDYLRDTAHLCAAEHGGYLLLIGHYWTTAKKLPDNDEHLRRIARMEKAEWRRARPVISAFFRMVDGFWIHDRIERELADWSERKEKSVERAERAARARWEKSNKHASGNAPSMPEAMLEECPSPSSTSVKKEEGANAPSKKSEARGCRLPQGWWPDDETQQWAAEQLRSPVSAKRETEKFANYWTAKPGAAGRKIDWVATYRNWIMNAAERLGDRNGTGYQRNEPEQPVGFNPFDLRRPAMAEELDGHGPASGPARSDRSTGDRVRAGSGTCIEGTLV